MRKVFNLKNKLTCYVKNLPGWTTKRKIVVFISDDWGDLRIRNEEDYRELLNHGFPVDKSPHTRYGALANHQDLYKLYETLTSVKDKNGRFAVFTPFTIMANPDFEKIREENFENYHYEKFPATIRRYDDGEKTLAAWKQGMEENLFLPELHGRDHLNVPLWLEHLKKGNERLLLAFKYHYAYHKAPGMPVSPALAFYFNSEKSLGFLKNSLKDGIKIFHEFFKRKPVVFNPPNGMFHPAFYEPLSEMGVKTVSSKHFRPQPGKSGQITKKYHRFGELSKNGILHYISNCAFEPVNKGFPGKETTLMQMAAAFRCRKPALINTHRVNYVGSRNPSVRDKNLMELSALLKKMKQKWPDIEFMSAGEFANYLKNSIESKKR